MKVHVAYCKFVQAMLQQDSVVLISPNSEHLVFVLNRDGEAIHTSLGDCGILGIGL